MERRWMLSDGDMEATLDLRGGVACYLSVPVLAPYRVSVDVRNKLGERGLTMS